MNDQLLEFVSRINNKAASESKMEVGKTIKHPDGRTVKIKSGQFLSGGRVSNYWWWNEVLPDGSLGHEESGYGW